MPSTANHTVAVGMPAADSGVFQTSPGMLRRRVLGPWAEGVKQYLALRLGDGRRGREAFQSLARIVNAMPHEELLAPPGPKGQLYHLARAVVETERVMPGFVAPDPVELRFQTGRRGRALARMRDGLDAQASELLELRYARELSLEELAFAMELTVPDAELALDQAEAKARQLLGSFAPDPADTTATAYVDAYAVARSWAEGTPPLGIEDDDRGLPAGTLIGGRYELLEHVGMGAFGDVYRAADVEVPGHVVALKLLRTPSLSESARQSALRELKLNAAVFHPSLVQFKDHGWFEQRLWFVMPWYEGETLEARMRRGALGRAEARRIFEPLARALAALHEAGIRHQDIKPENILLTRLTGHEDGALLPVLIDLGVAAEGHETMLGGTPLYFSPEVARRYIAEGHVGPEVDRPADVFALALSLRNALEPSTQAEVVSGAVSAFVAQRAEHPPPRLEGRDLRYLRATFDRWLSLDPSERPSAHELIDELAILTLPEERRARRGRILRWVLPILTLALVAGALGAYALERRGAEAREARAQAADARADLIVENARREALEEGHQALLQQYEQSRMSRGQLAAQLATTEGQTRILRGELSQAIARRDAVSAQLRARERALDDTRTERDDARAEIGRLSGTLRATERRAERAERAHTEASERAARAESARDAAASEVSRLTHALDLAERRAAVAQEQVADLTARVASAEASRDLALAAAEAARRPLAAPADSAPAEGSAESAEPASR